MNSSQVGLSAGIYSRPDSSDVMKFFVCFEHSVIKGEKGRKPSFTDGNLEGCAFNFFYDALAEDGQFT